MSILAYLFSDRVLNFATQGMFATHRQWWEKLKAKRMRTTISFILIRSKEQRKRADFSHPWILAGIIKSKIHDCCIVKAVVGQSCSTCQVARLQSQTIDCLAWVGEEYTKLPRLEDNPQLLEAALKDPVAVLGKVNTWKRTVMVPNLSRQIRKMFGMS